MGASLLSCYSSTFRSPGGGKEIDWRSNHTKKQIENEKKKTSFPPPGDSQSAQTCFFGMVKKSLNFETNNGHEWGAISSNRDETLSSDTSVIWSILWEGVQGGLGAGSLRKIEAGDQNRNWQRRIRNRFLHFLQNSEKWGPAFCPVTGL